MRAAAEVVGDPSEALASIRVLAVGGWSVRWDPRTVVVCVVGSAVCLGLAAAGLVLGDYPMDLPTLLLALVGGGPDPLASYFVQEIRAPRVVAAALVGAALAVSGAIFQALSSNPLGSPDVIGFTTGSATGALIQIVLIGAGPASVGMGALVGGAVTAALVYALAWRRGMTGSRLVLVGVGVAAVAQAVNSLLVVRAPLGAAQTASAWLAGSFNGMRWTGVSALGAALLVLLAAAVWLGRPLSALVLGDDLARGLGIGVELTRAGLVVVGVALVAVATATAGPIAFVALAAPQIARRLTGSVGTALVPAAIVGAALTMACDLLAQRLFAPTQLAVGVVTGTVGGAYLIWLLTREWRRGRG